MIVTAKGREKTYAQYFKNQSDPTRGCVDQILELSNFSDILDDAIQERLVSEQVIFIPNRSFEVYLHQRYTYDQIEEGMRVPIFGNRKLLRAEERDEPENQYALLRRARIRHPVHFSSPDEIDRLVMVKASHAEVSFERAFFLCSSPKQYGEVSQRLIKDRMLTEAALQAARIEEYALGPSVNLNFFYSPILKELELCGTDTRRQTNLDGLRSVPPAALADVADIAVRMEEAGHISTTLTESMLEQAFAMGERFIKVASEVQPPGIIGPFALQCVIVAGPPKEFVCYDVSLRIPGSPGSRFTPYSAYRWGRDVSVGERIAMEVVFARDAARLTDIVT